MLAYWIYRIAYLWEHKILVPLGLGDDEYYQDLPTVETMLVSTLKSHAVILNRMAKQLETNNYDTTKAEQDSWYLYETNYRKYLKRYRKGWRLEKAYRYHTYYRW